MRPSGLIRTRWSARAAKVFPCRTEILGGVQSRPVLHPPPSPAQRNRAQVPVLIRHDITLQDGSTRTLWDVVTGWWSAGEDADAGEALEHRDEATARARLRQHRPTIASSRRRARAPPPGDHSPLWTMRAVVMASARVHHP